eukprot:TRINITY_DN1039_c0_g1_i7.p1 TRINITY_DN1039_c0_g1~~TRINITY_DN1039_c0_g1_i7.p1  ORF type:complete len:1144 (+),score=234.88 TRINITY_DN1039_c0_g1_i7:137-3433(+)
MLGIRCLSITLSLALVVITGGIIGGLSITTGNRVTDQTKDTSQRGLDATHKVCNDGFDSLRKAQQDGLGACFTSGRDNAEYLGGLLLEQVKQVIVTKMKNLLDAPLQAVQQIYDTLATIPPAKLSDPIMWDEAHSRWIMHTWRAAQRRGVTQIQVAYTPGTQSDGLGDGKARFHIDHPATVGYPLDQEHVLMLVSEIPFKCYPGNTLSRSQCEQERCIWCNHNAGGAGYCGNPRRVEGEGDDAPWAPCKAGYTSTVTGPKPNYVSGYYLGTADEDGLMYIGTCGLDGKDEACGCQARFDFHKKLADNNGTVKGWPLGRPPRTGTTEVYQALPRIGSYRRRDGTWPEGLTMEADAVLESGACPLSATLQGVTALTGRQNGMPDRIGMTRWTPVGAGLPIPLLSVNVFKSWTHSSVPSFLGYIGAAIDTAGFSSFMKQVSLPPNSRMYAVQMNPWLGPPNKCQDDFHGLLALMGMSCATLNALKAVLGLTCDTDLRMLSSRLAFDNFLWKHCPESCGRCPWTLEETVGAIVGATHGETSVQVPIEESSYGNEGLHDLRALHVFNTSDPPIRNHARWTMTLPGHYEGFPSEEVVRWTDDDGLLWWTKVATITMPAELELLKIYLVILVQRDQAMKAIDEATLIVQDDINRTTAAVLAEVAEKRSSTAANIEKENKETEDQKEKDFLLMYIVVAICVALLMVVSVVFVHFTIAPLLVLEGEMADVATMKLEFVDRDRPLSQLGEVAQMQSSFLQMVRNLIEYRNYMPQSILCDGSDEEEEEEEERQGTGATPSSPKASSRGGTSSGGDRNKSSKQSIAMSKRSNFSRVEIAQKKFAGGPEELKKRPVSFCSFNLSGWHALLADKGDLLTATHSNYLSKAIAKITSTKGIPDTFCGDRIIGTFNGVKPCATHRAQAPLCGAGFLAQMKTEHPAMRITCATVSGDCKFGNMGCTGAKRFTFVGGTYTWACALERFCASIGTGILCDKWICSEAQNSLHVRIAAVVYFAKRAASDQVVHEILGEKAVSEDEWMYQLEEAAANDPHAAWNSFVAAVIEKRFDNAKEAMIKLEETLASGGGPPEAVLKMFQDAVRREEFESTPLLYH